jgi:YidC/Oxa1 family membrane protein insertase
VTNRWHTTAEGMPDMAKMMKIMIYVSPLMMLFSLIVIWVEFVLFYQYIYYWNHACHKNYIVDDDKIHAQIQENKKKSLRNKVNSTKTTRGYGTEAQRQRIKEIN